MEVIIVTKAQSEHIQANPEKYGEGAELLGFAPFTSGPHAGKFALPADVLETYPSLKDSGIKMFPKDIVQLAQFDKK